MNKKQIKEFLEKEDKRAKNFNLTGRDLHMLFDMFYMVGAIFFNIIYIAHCFYEMKGGNTT